MLDCRKFVCFIPVVLLVAVGCGGSSPSAPTAGGSSEGSSEGTAETAPPQSQPNALPEGIQPLSSQEAGPALAEPFTAAGIQYQMPDSWQAQAPGSMRVGQAAIPAPQGEAGGTGELAVFFFGPGGGGGVEANLQRWAGQMELAADPQRETFELDNGLRVTWLEAHGTLKASTMGVGPTTDQAGFRLFGAVVEGPGGPWFFKATGPDATLAAHRAGFLAMLRSVRPASPSA